jgi:NAD(P)-dependent dehydrogenase (short-subunit alcohol dehydrogenase family)
MDLAGKVGLITGGTSGIGAATALALARRGAHVATMSRNGKKSVSASFESAVKACGVGIEFLEGDVGKAEDCRRCVEQVKDRFGRVDLLVHSSGGAVPGDLFTVSEEVWMNAFAVHVHAIYHLTKSVVPLMAEQREGAIVLLGSAAGLRGCLGALAYGVAKGALPQFARALARELADKGIRVNCISPGIIRTPFQDFLTPEQVQVNVRNRIPLHREGKPEDVAELIVSVVQNDFITGENFVIDGGMTMRIV